MNKNIGPITFIDKLVKKNELGQPFKLMDHQRDILRMAFTFDEHGRLPWNHRDLFVCEEERQDHLERRRARSMACVG
jgi:hypothetical protein